MKSALIFSPYFDTFGGGEVYTLSFAACLARLGYTITLAASGQSSLSKAIDFHGIDLQARVDPKAHRILTTKSLINKWQLTRAYDLTFFLSDGSLPFLFSRKNLVHFQVPFTRIGSPFLNRLKLLTLNHIVCNSKFTKTVVAPQLDPSKTTVLYPPVAPIPGVKDSPKLNHILSVGRFTQTMHHKRQDVLVEAFKKMVDTGLSDYRLIIIGSTGESKSQEYVKKLRYQANGYPIDILTDQSRTTVIKHYQKARIFWLATGYDTDPTLYPERMEHFGIATVEAMSAGAVPVVIDRGGQPEIVTHAQSGFLFSTKTELVQHTSRLITHPKLWQQLSTSAIETSRQYSPDHFFTQIKSLLS